MSKLFAFIKSHAVLAGTLGFVVVVGAVVGGRAAHKQPISADVGANTKRVALVEVSSFRNSTSTVFADGIVEAASQADLKSQVGAPIAVINKKIGDNVVAGD